MDHNDVRQILLGLSDTPDSRDRMEAIQVVMRQRENVTRDWVIPFPGDRWGTFRLPSGLSEQDWAYLLGVLEAMKPGLVAPDPAPGPDAAAPTSNGE